MPEKLLPRMPSDPPNYAAAEIRIHMLEKALAKLKRNLEYRHNLESAHHPPVYSDDRRVVLDALHGRAMEIIRGVGV